MSFPNTLICHLSGSPPWLTLGAAQARPSFHIASPKSDNQMTIPEMQRGKNAPKVNLECASVRFFFFA
jgi:hypothetical protein